MFIMLMHLPEQSALSICSKVSLHALKATHAIMQYLRGWVQRKRSKWNDLWPSPAVGITVLSYKHMVCEDLAKRQVLQQR